MCYLSLMEATRFSSFPVHNHCIWRFSTDHKIEAHESCKKQLKNLYATLFHAREKVDVIAQAYSDFLDMRYQQDREANQKYYNRTLATIEYHLDGQIKALQKILTLCAHEGKIAVADWDDAQWSQWKPFPVPTPFVRAGVWKVHGPRERELSPIPALVANPGLVNILIEFDGTSKTQALGAAQSIMLRLLATHPPGKLRFALIDPIGLGQNVATFMQLPDEDERLISHSKAWTEAKHIEKELADLSEHMENVIQKYLRNQFNTIDEYNAVAGPLAEPYRVLVVIGCPVNFSAESARRLVNISTSGPPCGVYTLILLDTEQTRLPRFTPAELECAASTIVWNGQNYVWKQKKIGDSQLLLDAAPPPEIFQALLKKIGREAQKADQKVEIPFQQMVQQCLPEESWWAEERKTHESIDVPLGSSGATRYQYVHPGYNTTHHILVVGKTGSGKTNLLHVLIMALCLSYHPDELELYLVDFKRVGFTPYATYKLPHARVIAIQSEREFGISVLDGVEHEMEARQKLFSKRCVQDITLYRRDRPGERMPRIFLLVDEFQEFFSQDDEIAHKAALSLEHLARMGRAFGIHVLLGSQTLAGAFSITRPTISQMAVRIAMQCEEADSRNSHPSFVTSMTSWSNA